MKYYSIAIFMIIAFSSPLGRCEEQMTNPCLPWVEEFQLSNYDTALDEIDYSPPYEKVIWPWENDSQRQEKRIEALKAIVGSGGNLYRGSDSFELPVDYLSFSEKWDEWCEELLFIPHTINDRFLETTLSCIPDIASIYFRTTQNLSDKGLQTFFYLPCLEEVTLGTIDQEKYPLKISDAGIVLLSKHPSLKRLTLFGIPVSQTALESIVTNGKKLRFLSINISKLPENATENLNISKSLTSFSLTIQEGDISFSIFNQLKTLPSLTFLSLQGADFSVKPDSNVLESLLMIQKRKILCDVLFGNHTKLHPFLLKPICQIRSIKNIDLFEIGTLFFTPDHPICYERVMYELYKKNAVPEYYQKLEKEFEEELKWHTWADKKGKTVKAKLVKIGKEKVSLEKEDGAEITISRTSLSQDDQLYLQELERLEEDKKNDAAKWK